MDGVGCGSENPCGWGSVTMEVGRIDWWGRNKLRSSCSCYWPQ
jgi:hypothetical protein